jgi:hypothetical protein
MAGDSSGTDAMKSLVDRTEIRDTLLRYCRGVDRRDWELVRAAFFEDCEFDHADFHGKRDEFIAWLSERHDAAGFRKSSHLLSNCLIEFSGADAAVVETYFTARLEFGEDSGGHRAMLSAAEGAGGSRAEVLGRYIDRFERRAGQWRSARRRTVFDQQSSQPIASGAAAINPAWVLGTRDAHDPIYAAREDAGLRSPSTHSPNP